MTEEATAANLFDVVGGEPFFRRLVDTFYDAVAADEVLVRLYPEAPDLTGARHRLRLFLVQYWGGPTTYSDERGHPRLRLRHLRFHIGREERDRWLEHMSAAIDAATAELPDPDVAEAVAATLSGYFHPTAEQMRNDTGLPISRSRSGRVNVIEVRDLRKEYGAIRAVDGLSFEVSEGEVYALLGENGAGKSTTVEILEGHRGRSSGDVAVLGCDPGRAGRDFRDRIGIVLQSSGVEHELTVREAVTIYSSCYSTRRPVLDVVELVGLTPQLDQRVGHLSGGQQRRLDLALGIAGSPALLFLDEPTTGFDPAARRQAWDLVRDLCSEGTTVLLTTHYLDEAEHLADRVGVLARGCLVAEGTPDELIGGSGTTVVRFDLPAGASASDLRGVLPDGAVVAADRVEFTTSTPTAAVHAVTGWAVGRGVELSGLVVTRPSLEDVFLQLAGRDARS